MEITISRVLWVVLTIVVAVMVGLGLYTWATTSLVKTDFLITGKAYTDGRVELNLKNTGTVDITGIAVSVIKADGSALAAPVALAVTKADGNAFDRLAAGDEVQLICADWTSGGTVTATNTITIEFRCTFANGRVVSHVYTFKLYSF